MIGIPRGTSRNLVIILTGSRNERAVLVVFAAPVLHMSLALIVNASGQTFGAERDIEPRRFR